MSEWIKTSERMPERTDTVLVVDGGIEVYPATFYEGSFYEYGDTFTPCRISNRPTGNRSQQPHRTNHDLPVFI
ncbi:DUF551 domain-containing protein [Pectobacterium carotovorum]|uniref:DUF551 domain-containing protein n=1 Tax=Pectobacterium carotovorum TaxID=554 RepID=UPI0039B6FBEC